MLSVYPACFFKEKKGYSVVFPDLNWLATSGESEKEALNKAVECLAGYLYIQKIDHVKVQAPSKISEINVKKIAKELDADSSDAYVCMVSVDVEEYAKANFEKSVRKTLTIPAWLDKLAQEKKINFSKTLQEALMEKVRR